MPSWCAYNSLWPSLMILILVCGHALSTADSHHQVLKADVGQDLTLTCVFDEGKLEQVSFMRQMTGDILSLGDELFVHQPDIELRQFSSTRLDLKLKSVKLNDSGLYTCMFNDDKLVSFLVEIFVAPHFVSYSPAEGSIASPENSTLNFSCQAFAIPAVNISWIFKNKLKQSRNIHHGENLLLRGATSSDSGLYECVASNMYHASISRAFYVTVQYAPTVLILNEQRRSSLHETVTMQCRACAIPAVEHIDWLRDDRPVDDINVDVKRRTVDEHCSESVMKIMSINERQFGHYECRATNLLGAKSDHTVVQMLTPAKVRRVKQKVYADEINRNGRTAQASRRRKNQTSTASEHILVSGAIRRQRSYWWIAVAAVLCAV